ncbi:MAG: calcium/proton exchanger [Fischerella sp. CENA71]|nr:calcium/proton exchanger [Fischerella sp. CENA71]
MLKKSDEAPQKVKLKAVFTRAAIYQPSIHWLAIFLPISFAVAFIPLIRNEIGLFFTSCLGMIVVAYWIGEATDQLAERVGVIWGGMLNAAFSNLPELIFGLIAVTKGLGSLAKAAWTGAIISNMLVVVGAAIVVGGYRYGTVTFPLERAKDAAAGLMIAAAAILMPSIYAHAVDFSSEKISADDVISNVSLWLCVFLLMAYGGSLVYTLAKSRAFGVFERNPSEQTPALEAKLPWSIGFSVGVLAVSSFLIAMLSDFVADCVDSITAGLGWTEIFVGAIIIGIIGNVGALMSAVLVAVRNKMDLSFEIGMNAASQIALLVIPMLIISSNVVGKPVDFLFSPPQIAALLGSVIIVAQISQDGRCNWLNGLQMLIFFGVIGVLFYFDPT